MAGIDSSVFGAPAKKLMQYFCSEIDFEEVPYKAFSISPLDHWATREEYDTFFVAISQDEKQQRTRVRFALYEKFYLKFGCVIDLSATNEFVLSWSSFCDQLSGNFGGTERYIILDPRRGVCLQTGYDGCDTLYVPDECNIEDDSYVIKELGLFLLPISS